MLHKLRNLHLLLIVLATSFVAAGEFLTFIPSWADVWPVLCLSICLLLLALTLLRLVLSLRPGPRQRSGGNIAALLASAIIPLGLIFTLLIQGAGFLSEPTFVEAFHDTESGNSLYYYELSEFPNPGADLRLYYRSGFLPLMWELGTWKDCWPVGSTVENGVVQLTCGRTGTQLQVEMRTGEVAEVAR